MAGRPQEAERRWVRRSRNGTWGGGSILRLLIGGEESRGAVTVVEVLVQEGGPPLHVHDAEDEAVVVLEGELAYRIGDERDTAVEHEMVWLPRGIPHTVANLSGRPCRFLTFATPAGIEKISIAMEALT